MVLKAGDSMQLQTYPDIDALQGQSFDPRLQPTMRALAQLSPANQELAMNLIRQLAEREGINVALSPAMGLQVPAEGIDIWVAKLQIERYSPRTIKRYRWAVERYLEQDPFPTSMSIREYLARRLKEVSPALTSFERKALKSLFDFLHEEGLWNTNPVNGIKPIPVSFRERRLPSEEAVQKLLQAKHYRKQDTAKFRLLVALLLDTGLRVSEAAGILKKDIDIENLEIRVIGKGDKERVVPISPVTVGLIGEYLTAFDRQDSPYLFPTVSRTGYWDYTGIEKMMSRTCKRLGIEHITPHQLRHFFATYALKDGAKLEVISRILGHASVGITADIYRHVGREEIHLEHRRHGPLSQMLALLPEGRT